MILYFKYKPIENKFKELTVKLEVDPMNSFTIMGGSISVSVTPSRWEKTMLNTDNFSRLLREFGFDEDDVRMEIEDFLEAREKEEIV